MTVTNTIVTSIAFSLISAGSLLAHPPCFTDMEYQAAIEQTTKDKKVLIFDAMTSWCGPCKMMDKTAWVDPAVVDWISSNAVAIQLDMDHHKDLGKSLEIHAYPTIIVFKDGKEFDRIVGARDGAGLLEWLKGAKEGFSARDQTLKALAAAREDQAEGKAVDYGRRLDLAQDLHEYGCYQESGEECAFLWSAQAAESPALTGDRRARLGGVMASLATRHPASRGLFVGLRDAVAGKALSPAPAQADLLDWVALNGILDEHEATVRWALSMADTSENVEVLQSVGPQVFELLIQQDHWSVAGLALTDPVAEVEQHGSQLGAYDLKADAAKSNAMPMIPLKSGGGGMLPAIPLKSAPKEDGTPSAPPPPPPPPPSAPAEEPAKAPTTLPAIPLKTTPATPTAPAAIPAIPLTVGKDAPPADFDRNDPAQVATEIRRRLTIQFREIAGKYYAACLASGRDAEGEGVAAAALKYADDPKTRLQLVTWALKAKQSRPVQKEWLAQAAAAGLDVSELSAQSEK